jgi:hypothetical protein
MAFFRGQQGTVFFDKAGAGGLSEIAAVRSWSMSVEKESLECTDHGDTYRAYVGGLISGSGSIELMYDAPSAGDKLDLITDVNQATDEADAAFELYLDEAGGKKITGSLVVTGSEYSATVGEIEVITVSFVTSGALTLTI